MPIYLGKSKLDGDKKFIRRIPFKGEGDKLKNLKRVYFRGEDGKERLKWGRYDLSYYYGANLPESVTLENQLSEYVWGLEYELPLEEGSPITDRRMNYNTRPAPENYQHKWYGWFQGDTQTPYKWGLENDVIGKDYHWDCDLYSNWKQKKYTYSGDYSWSEWVEHGAVREEAPNPYYDEYYNYRSEYCMPNCVYYVWWRVIEAGAESHPATGMWSGHQWYDNPNTSGGWYQVSASELGGIDNALPGDVLCFGGDGSHVAFVEGDGTVTQSAWTEGYCGASNEWPRTSSNQDVYDQVVAHWDEIYSGRSNYGWRWWNRADSPSQCWSQCGGTFQGVLRYSGTWSGGGGEWVKREGSVDETDCKDQENPDAPLPDEIAGLQDAKWENLYKKTYVRGCEYQPKEECTWPEWLDVYKDDDWDSTWPNDGMHKLTVNSNKSTWGHASGGGMFAHGTNVVIQANPVDSFKYKFVSWSDGNTEASREIVLEDDMTLTANFECNIEWDYSTEEAYNEIDLLNTTDVHGYWRGYEEDDYTKYNYADVRAKVNELAGSGVLAFPVDCGDWSHGGSRINECMGKDAVDQMNNNNYFAVVYGNHEWKWGSSDNTMSILKNLKSMTACNLLKDGKPVFKPYRAIHTKNMNVAIIGVGFPAANDQGTDYQGYHFLDSFELYKKVQYYINWLNEAGIDKIAVIAHMAPKGSIEEDTRYKARCDQLILHTYGLSVVCPGHAHITGGKEIVKDAVNNDVLMANEAGLHMNCFGRVRFTASGVESELYI